MLVLNAPFSMLGLGVRMLVLYSKLDRLETDSHLSDILCDIWLAMLLLL